MNAQALDRVYVPLRLCYGLVPIVAGADKFFNLLTDWSQYLPAFMLKLVPLSPEAFMRSVGVIEMAAGLAVLTVLPRLGAYVVAIWLASIAATVAVAGFFDIAVRDLVMALGAYTLGTIAALKGEKLLPQRPTSDQAALATARRSR